MCGLRGSKFETCAAAAIGLAANGGAEAGRGSSSKRKEGIERERECAAKAFTGLHGRDSPLANGFPVHSPWDASHHISLPVYNANTP